MAWFLACPVVPLSWDNEGTSVPLSWKVALSRPIGNPSLNSTIYFNLTDWRFKGLSHCAMLSFIETLQPVLLYWLPYTFSYTTLILFAISIKRWARWHTWTFPVILYQFECNQIQMKVMAKAKCSKWNPFNGLVLDWITYRPKCIIDDSITNIQSNGFTY